VKELSVRLEVEDRVKTVIVRGERRWVRSLASFTATDPQPFTEMPLIYERAFGGWSEGRKPVDMRVERRNPVGIGFHATDGPERIDGAPLPNLERPERPITSPRECLEPVGYGVVGRSWLPRVARAGTYDARWRDERAPFLPEDFDSRYFQCAPDDQQFPHFRGGEQLRCVHMASQSVVQYVIPRLEMRVWFRFFDDVVEQAAVLDTVTLEPHDSLATIVWRASTPLRKKLADLEHIFVGEPPGGTRQRSGRTDVKPVFSGLGEAVAWARRRRGCST
jgi:hypothetical protein